VLVGDEWALKITDFGLAKRLDDAGGPTQSGEVMGTPAYMAPEQAQGRKDVGPAADVWALGAILYELLTGRPPFRGPNVMETVQQVLHQEPVPPRRLRPKAPRDLETAYLKCLQKRPGDRYAAAEALADDLRRFLNGRPVQARPVGRAKRLWRWAGRNKALAAAAAAVAAAVLLAAGLTAFYLTRQAAADAELARKGKALESASSGKAEAEKGAEEKERKRREAASRAALEQLKRGLDLCRQKTPGEGLPWLAAALETAPPDDEPLQTLIRANLAAWGRPLGRTVLPGKAEAVQFGPDGRTAITARTVGGSEKVQRWDLADGGRGATRWRPPPVCWRRRARTGGGASSTARRPEDSRGGRSEDGKIRRRVPVPLADPVGRVRPGGEDRCDRRAVDPGGRQNVYRNRRRAGGRCRCSRPLSQPRHLRGPALGPSDRASRWRAASARQGTPLGP
jgi:hypothetical protein